jgi:hypothetical protein
MKGLHVVGLVAVLIAGNWPANAASQLEPPRPGCATVQKQEYDAAKKKGLLRTRNGEYVRTGGLLRRQFWYCH